MGENKKIKALYGQNITTLLFEANERGVPGNKVITILPLHEQYVMIYYGESN